MGHNCHLIVVNLRTFLSSLIIFYHFSRVLQDFFSQVNQPKIAMKANLNLREEEGHHSFYSFVKFVLIFFAIL